MSGESDTRLGRRLLLWANLLAAQIAAVTCVLAFINPGFLWLPMNAPRLLLIHLNSREAKITFAVAAVLLVLNLWALLKGRGSDRTPRQVTSVTATGEMAVSREALESGLRSAGEAIPEITRLRVHLAPNRPRRVVIQAQFQCPDEISNLHAAGLLRDRLRQRFDEMVQLPDGVRAEFAIEFLGFGGKLQRKIPAKGPEDGVDAASAEVSPPPFTGPQYPIDDESADS